MEVMGRSRRDITRLKGLQTLIMQEIAAAVFLPYVILQDRGRLLKRNGFRPARTLQVIPLEALLELGGRFGIAASGVCFRRNGVIAAFTYCAPGWCSTAL